MKWKHEKYNNLTLRRRLEAEALKKHREKRDEKLKAKKRVKGK